MSRFVRILAFTALALGALPGAARAALPDGFTDELVAGGLSQPVGMAFLPDGRILVAEQKTRLVRLVVNGVTQAGSVLSIADVNISGNERGLLGVAVDPAWPARPYIYCYFDRTPGDVVYISRFTGTGDLSDGTSGSLAFGDRFDILTDIPDNASNHNGGTLLFGIDGMLHASIGEDADPCAAQDSTLLKGVILRLDVSALPAGPGGPPAKASVTPGDNPFPATNANAGLAFAYGLRNPFRFTVDPANGRLFIADVGQNAFEELDVATGGENFGWPFREAYTVRTQSGCAEPGGSGSQSYDAPILSFAHGAGAASLIAGPAYRAAASPGGEHVFPAPYDGAVFYSEYYSGVLRVVTESGGIWSPLSPVPGQPNATDWGTGYAFVSQWVQGADGAIYYVQQGGSIRRILGPENVGAGDPATVPGPALRALRNPVRFGDGPLAFSVRIDLDGETEAEILDIRGAVVGRLSLTVRAGEEARFTWDGRTPNGAPAGPGVYFVRVRGGVADLSARFVALP